MLKLTSDDELKRISDKDIHQNVAIIKQRW